MKITRRQLRRLIKEETSRLDEVVSQGDVNKALEELRYAVAILENSPEFSYSLDHGAVDVVINKIRLAGSWLTGMMRP